MEFNRYIDHTLLRADATLNELRSLCEEAKAHEFYAVCVNSARVFEVRKFLEGSKVKLAATIGFPLGASSPSAKISEAQKCIEDGADEVDMVMNIGFFKDGAYSEVLEEIKAVKEAVGAKILKVIIETCYLTDAEIKKATQLVLDSSADFVKTSTGFGSRGASLKDIRLMKEVIGDKLKIKASGGIRDAATARQYLELGVQRIGTSSGIKIVSSH